MTTAAEAVTSRPLGSRPIAGLARRASRRDLRILAYHEVPDAATFDAQLEHLAEHYRFVSCADVLGWLSGQDLGRRPLVWLTFDDADPSVVETGLPVLDAHAAPATVFQVAAVVDTTEPFWWQLAQRALDRGAPITTVRELKVMPDRERRAHLGAARRHLEAHDPDALVQPQMTTALLRSWVESGREVGNHTWDHPCLDRCGPAEPREQIERADAWLTTLDPGHPRAFAYPNGNYDAAADAALHDLGYAVGLLAGHRLTPRGSDPLRLERLRTDAQVPVPRFRAIVSGAHSTAFHLVKRA